MSRHFTNNFHVGLVPSHQSMATPLSDFSLVEVTVSSFRFNALTVLVAQKERSVPVICSPYFGALCTYSFMHTCICGGYKQSEYKLCVQEARAMTMNNDLKVALCLATLSVISNGKLCLLASTAYSP